MKAQGQPEDFNPERLGEAIGDVASRYQRLWADFLARQGRETGATLPPDLDPLGAGQAFLDLTAALAKNPQGLLEAQTRAWNGYAALWFNTANKLLGGDSAPVAAPERGDRRFRHEAWDDNPFFSFVKQSYLLAADAVQSAVASGASDLDQQTARKARFYTQQHIDALSPTNFLLTNPEVAQATIESGGENLLKGLQNFMDDFDAETGHLRVAMTDPQAFELGRNIAATPGKVVFQNDLLQLLRYAPATKQVFRRPLLILPPWINKYYVLDLRPENSMIKWLTEQGHTVFVASWVNPDQTLAELDFEHYVTDGALAAIDAVERNTGEDRINLVGYCIGGTLLAATLAWMREKQDLRAASATFFVTLLDFSIPGDLGAFIDEQQLDKLEQRMSERGYHDGKDMALTFNMLRANDLIWSFYVRNYLLGQDPAPFDLLYWNADSTRLPAKMHSTYLRAMYLENRFKEPGGLRVDGVPLDLSAVETPAYFIATEEDHIAPWEGVYLSAGLLSGPVKFVLGQSGHIAGIINPPAANKYGYRAGPAPNIPAAEWREQAQVQAGSWWLDWQAWLEQHAAEKIPARRPGDKKQSVIEDAPGSYVKQK